MGTRIPPEVIATVKDRTDLVGLVARRVRLRKAGGSYVGLCPFHQEKTPSFHVVPRKQFFHCFGCKESGGAIDFLIKLDGKTFREAVAELAYELGLSYSEQEYSPWDNLKPSPDRYKAAVEKLGPVPVRPEHSIQQFGRVLKRYLFDRGVTVDAARAFGLGSDDEANRATMPVRLPNGGLVGVSGRSIRPEEKKLKLLHYRYDLQRERFIAFVPRWARDKLSDDEIDRRFPTWPRNRLLYGMHVIAQNIVPPCGWRSDDLALVEGQVDTQKTWQRGLRTLGLMGSFVSAEQGDWILSLLPRRGRLLVMFDPDKAGKKCVESLRPLMTGRAPMLHVQLPPVRPPTGRTIESLTDEEWDQCPSVDPGNCTDDEFEPALWNAKPLM